MPLITASIHKSKLLSLELYLFYFPSFSRMIFSKVTVITRKVVTLSLVSGYSPIHSCSLSFLPADLCGKH